MPPIVRKGVHPPTILAGMLRNLFSICEKEPEEQMASGVRAFLELLENEQLDSE